MRTSLCSHPRPGSHPSFKSANSTSQFTDQRLYCPLPSEGAAPTHLSGIPESWPRYAGGDPSPPPPHGPRFWEGVCVTSSHLPVTSLILAGSPRGRGLCGISQQHTAHVSRPVRCKSTGIGSHPRGNGQDFSNSKRTGACSGRLERMRARPIFSPKSKMTLDKTVKTPSGDSENSPRTDNPLRSPYSRPRAASVSL